MHTYIITQPTQANAVIDVDRIFHQVRPAMLDYGVKVGKKVANKIFDNQSKTLDNLIAVAEQYYNAGMFDQAQGMLIPISAMAQEIGNEDIQKKIGELYDKIVKEK